MKLKQELMMQTDAILQMNHKMTSPGTKSKEMGKLQSKISPDFQAKIELFAPELALLTCKQKSL